MGNPDTWYPIHWLIALIWGFDLPAMQFSFLLHLYIAGLGFYHLGKYYRWTHLALIGTSVSYMLSGFALSHAQHLGWIIGMAWLPWLWWALHRLLLAPSFSNAVLLSIIGQFFVTGSYPGLSIISAYLVLGVILYQIWLNKSRPLMLSRIMKYLLFALLVFLLLSGPCLIAVADVAKQINRGTGLSTDEGIKSIFLGDLPWRGVFSFLFPFATSTDHTFWETSELSILNCYIGLLPLAIIFSIFFKEKKVHRPWVFILLGLFLLMTAIPNLFPFRRWLYQILPLMGYFRFPTLFRLPAIFFFLLATGQLVKKIELPRNGFRKQLFPGLLILGFGLIMLLGYLANHNGDQLFNFAPLNDWESFMINATLIERTLLQGSIHATLIFSFFIIRWIFKKPQTQYLLLLFWILDLFFAVQLQSQFTVIDTRGPAGIEKETAILPSYFPLPRIDLPLTELSQLTQQKGRRLPINTNIFHKIPSANGDSPFSFTNMNRAIEKGRYQQLIQHPLLFLTTSIQADSSINDNDILFYQPDQLNISSFHPNGFSAAVQCDTNTFLVFLQNYFPRWVAQVDGEKQEIQRVNDTFMAIAVPKGMHHISFQFKFPLLVKAVWLSGILSIFLWAYLIRGVITQLLLQRKKWVIRGILSLFLFCFLLAGYRHFSRKQAPQLQQQLVTSIDQFTNDHSLQQPSILLGLENNPLGDTTYDVIPLWHPRDPLVLMKRLQQTTEPHVIIGEFYPLPRRAKWLTYAKLFYGPVVAQDSTAEMRFYLLEKQRSVPIWSSDSLQSWPHNNRDTSFYLSAKQSLYFNAKREFGNLFNTDLSAMSTNENIRAVTHFKLYNPHRNNAIIVFEIYRDGHREHWFGKSVRPLCKAVNTWQEITVIQPLPNDLMPGDELRVLFWNSEKKEMWLDDALGEIYVE